MEKEMRNLLIKNIIKFIIWSWLLAICFVYLGSHPAEKAAVFSGFEVMYQKVNIVVHKTIWSNGDMLEKKYNLQKYYKELLRIAEDQKCLDIEAIKALRESYETLKKESLSEFSNNASEYTHSIYKYDSIIKKWC